MRAAIKTDTAPTPGGHYSQAIKTDNLVFVSGQGPYDVKQGQMVSADVATETRITLENVKAILEAAGTSMENVARCGVFLADIGDFQAMNEVYKTFWPGDPPARTTVAVSLGGGIKVEIDVVAALP